MTARFNPQVDAWVGSDTESDYLVRLYADGTFTAERKLHDGGYTGEVRLEPEPWSEWVANQFFVADDCLWQHSGDGESRLVQRRSDTDPAAWSVLVRWARGSAEQEARTA